MLHALLVDKNPDSVARLSESLNGHDFSLSTSASLKAAHRAVARQFPDLVLLTLNLEDGDALDLLRRTELSQASEVLLIDDKCDEEVVGEALDLGVADYFTRPVDLARFDERMDELVRRLETEAAKNAADLDLFVGSSASMHKVHRLLKKVAPTNASVLLYGQSGTGKELAARAIHKLSQRSKGEFVAMNCGAISPELIESELFGHVKGSFTGASRDHRGYFERADGGTLLLDEVTEMPPAAQVKLLRVLETGEFKPVGGEETRQVNVRVIATTNRQPHETIEDGTLREDLYYLLAQFVLRMPTLSERGRDVVLLAKYFLKECNEKNGEKKAFGPTALEQIRSYDWPGNVRELKNAVERGHIVAGETIRGVDLPVESNGAQAKNANNQAAEAEQVVVTVGASLEQAEKQLILATLAHHGGRRRETAATLGISVKTLYNRLKQYEDEAVA